MWTPKTQPEKGEAWGCHTQFSNMASLPADRGQAVFDLALKLVGRPIDEERFRELFTEVSIRCSLGPTAELQKCIPPRLDPRSLSLAQLAAIVVAISTECPEIVFLPDGCDKALLDGLMQHVSNLLFRFQGKDLGKTLTVSRALMAAWLGDDEEEHAKRRKTVKGTV